MFHCLKLRGVAFAFCLGVVIFSYSYIILAQKSIEFLLTSPLNSRENTLLLFVNTSQLKLYVYAICCFFSFKKSLELNNLIISAVYHKCLDQETAVDTDRECSCPRIH